MRQVVCSVLAAAALGAATLSGASAQSIIDLSKPQTGKSRFVLNADMTPADLGGGEEKKPLPVAAVSRTPACGEGCKLEQADLPHEQRYGATSDSNAYRTRGGTRVILVGNMGGSNSQPQQTAKPAPAPRKTFRFRRR